VADDGADLALVLMTAPDSAVAERLSKVLLEERLVACATVMVGVLSMYYWQGEMRADSESQVLLKTRRSLVPRVFKRIAELHPYDLPELVAAPLEWVSEEYGKWVLEETEHQQGGGAELPRATRVDDGPE
jgi:periplasmic divalent cation tolerance protein